MVAELSHLGRCFCDVGSIVCVCLLQLVWNRQTDTGDWPTESQTVQYFAQRVPRFLTTHSPQVCTVQYWSQYLARLNSKAQLHHVRSVLPIVMAVVVKNRGNLQMWYGHGWWFQSLTLLMQEGSVILQDL